MSSTGPAPISAGSSSQIAPASQNCINVMAIRKVDRSVDELLDGPGVEKSLLAAKIQRLHISFPCSSRI